MTLEYRTPTQVVLTELSSQIEKLAKTVPTRNYKENKETMIMGLVRKKDITQTPRKKKINIFSVQGPAAVHEMTTTGFRANCTKELF